MFFLNECKIIVQSNCTTFNASVFFNYKESKNYRLNDLCHFSCAANQAIKPPSRCLCPFPLTESSFSLMVLSMNLIKYATSRGCSPCLREFFSLHIVCTVRFLSQLGVFKIVLLDLVQLQERFGSKIEVSLPVDILAYLKTRNHLQSF